MPPKHLDSRREQLKNILNYTANRFPLTTQTEPSVEFEQSRQALARIVGVANTDILNELEALGYSHETARILHLVPLVQVAWADGFVTQQEHSLILELAMVQNIKPGSPSHMALEDWLTHRPSLTFFKKSWLVIRRLIEAGPSSELENSQRNLLSCCTRVASASGGILGFWHPISDAERVLLEQIGKEMEKTHGTATLKVWDEWKGFQ